MTASPADESRDDGDSGASGTQGVATLSSPPQIPLRRLAAR